MTLFDLKNILLKELCTFNIETNTQNGFANIEEIDEFITFTFSFDSISLQSLCQYSTASPLCYIRSKDNLREDFAIGSCRKFKSQTQINNLKELLVFEKLTFFGGQKFNPIKKSSIEWEEFGNKFYFLPRVWLSNKQNHQSELVIYIDKTELKNNSINEYLIFEIEQILNFQSTEDRCFSKDKKNHFLYDYQVPGLEKWHESISTCLRRLNHNLEKIVLSRKQVYKATFQDVLATFLQRDKQNNNHYIFLLKLDQDHLFLSLTPEKLFQVDHSTLTSDAIAGTRSRGGTIELDNSLEKELLDSDKELREHRIVAHEVSKVFEKTCTSFDRLSKEEVLKLSHVQHLKSSFKGYLNSKVDLLELINFFHPTPAVGGFPKKPALELINELEGYDRGFYSAPVGIISKNYSEMIVAIRSALLHKSNLHVYGGAGIVSGSDAKQEWTETHKKMNTIKEYIL
jgi:menaquinone-specific isochorismate synthase